jgi:taurine dioxygenase
MPIEVVPCAPALGAEIRGVDLSKPLDGDDLAAIEKTWLDHGVLLFRNQQLTDDDLVRFSACFGVPDRAPPNEAQNTTSDGSVPDLPEITVISNVVENGVEIGSLGAGECAWHADMTYKPDPPSACMLYALELPKHGGGGTGFLDMRAAYETLGDGLKQKIRDKQAIHDATYTSAGTLRKGYEPVDDVSKAPGARHPMVVRHPGTGREALLLGRRQNSYILGLPVEESEALLNEIWAHATRDKFAWNHEWRIGDLVLWDNRCTMHVRHAFDENDRRIMHRTQIRSEGPYYLA